MFAALGNAAPKLPRRRALVVLNIQNDSFGKDDLVVCHPTDFLDRVGAMIPHYRKLGDIIWIRTEFEPDPNAGTDGSARSSPRLDSPRGTSIGSSDSSSVHAQNRMGLENYFPSNRQRARKRKEARPFAEPAVSEDVEVFEDEERERIDDYVKKSRKGQLPDLYVPGSRGADFPDPIKPLVDNGKDVVMVKHHYSGFDATPLLMTLRMKFVTHIYLCGLLSNVSIYETAADAVRHGFEVTVVEDCMGYRSETKHVEAMRKMADFLGVSGIDSEEIIAEAGGQAPPDADESTFTGPGMAGINTQPFRHASQALSGISHLPVEMEGVETTEQIGAAIAERLDIDSHTSPSGGTQTPQPAQQSGSRPKVKPSKFSQLPLKGPGDSIGEGDSTIIHNALSVSLATDAFKLIKDEVDWQVMHHRTGEVPRRVAVQGDIGPDGSLPVYRHPADESPPLRSLTRTVQKVREELQRILKQPFNHCLIQLYRDGNDNISEHSDKTLDIVRGSSIINVSFGAQRRMTLRTKKSANPPNPDGSVPVLPRQVQTVPMPHNSIFVLGWRSNMKWLHGVRPDKRPRFERSPEEIAYNGERISLTFRHIGTFLTADQSKIWGQGAVSKIKESAGTVSNTDSRDMESMVIAFGKENQASDFDWDAEYGRGFDVMNLVTAKSTLFLSSDEIANLRVRMCLLHSGINCRITRQPGPSPSTPASSVRSVSSARRNIFSLSPSDSAPIFRDVDPGFSEVVGDLAILFYLKNLYPTGAPGSASAAQHAQHALDSGKYSSREMQRLATNVFARITQANELLFLWQDLRGRPLTASTRATHQIRRLSSDTMATGASSATGGSTPPGSGAGTAATSTSASSHSLHPASRLLHAPVSTETTAEAFDAELAVWEEFAQDTDFIAGDTYAIVDCAFWPVLNEVVRRWEGWSERKFPALAAYWRKVGAMDSTRGALGDTTD